MKAEAADRVDRSLLDRGNQEKAMELLQAEPLSSNGLEVVNSPPMRDHSRDSRAALA